MKSQTVKRATMLALAVALIVTNTVNLQAQRDTADSTSTSTTKSKIDPAIKQASSSFKSDVPAGVSRSGKATLSQTGAIGSKIAIPGTDPKKVVSNSPKMTVPAQPVVTQAGSTAAATSGSQIKQAGLVDSSRGITNDGLDPLTAERKPHRIQQAPDVVMTPADRGAPPGIVGRNLGLIGQTATEQLVQAKMTIQQLESENQQLRQQLTGTQGKLKESNDHLFTIIREVQSAKKELTQARADLERMRGEVTGLRDKIKQAEREHANFLQSMGPLLKQLLDPDEVSGLPPNDTE